MRTRKTMTISLPPKMIEEVEKVRRQEHRTRSELVREALRVYLARIRSLLMYTPTARELREIKKGREAMKRGEYYTLDEFSKWLLGSPGKKARTKKATPRPTR